MRPILIRRGDSGIARRHLWCREKSWCPLRTKQKDQPKTIMSLPCPFAPRNDGGGRGLPPSAAERRGRRSLRSEFLTPSGYWRPVERAQWCYSTTGLPERIVRGHWPQKIPRFRRTGGFLSKLFDPIRRAETSDWSGSFTRVVSSKTFQSRVCPRPLAATKGPPGGRVVLLSDPDEGSRDQLEEAISSGRGAPDTGIITNCRSFDNLWKVKK